MNKLNANQVEKLIESIKKSPAIFDKADKYYKLVSMKDRTWQDISSIVGAEENECKTAWKSLRTQFVKAVKENKRKPGQKASGKKTYKYYNQLLFLKDSIGTKKQSSNCVNQLIEKCDDLLYDDDTDVFEQNEDVVMEQIKEPSVSNISTPRSASPRFSRSIKLEDKPQDHEHLKEFLNSIVTEIKSTNETKQDDIQTFFMVIANMVMNANLTRFQNRQIQRKVFSFVTEELDKLDNDEANK